MKIDLVEKLTMAPLSAFKLVPDLEVTRNQWIVLAFASVKERNLNLCIQTLIYEMHTVKLQDNGLPGSSLLLSLILPSFIHIHRPQVRSCFERLAGLPLVSSRSKPNPAVESPMLIIQGSREGIPG